MSTQVPSPKVKLTSAALESLDGMSYIHVLHGFRVCYPIFWDVARDSFSEQDKVRGLQEALAKLQDFDYGLGSSNDWSVDQKIWGIGVAIAVLEDILSSPDVAKAFRLAKMNVEDWMEHDNLLEPNMNVSRYLSPMQDPLLRQEILARHYHWLEFNLPAAPEHLQKFLPKLERHESVEEPEEKQTDSREGTESGPVDEIADSFCNIKID
ncbi:hypothetical protein FVEG_13562 [Fusarium verticillioides 7600]|uniref:Uncharacterized protein n=1 Tax=Gibberella moniliformis (strain M3125 / FGSC 7600) TaxID=334819 RepID=W7N685_GIBM7|nr:hypothetical protein FVEG_13562 [Fusarium verticillioides 7600]EWG55580.1 hypothetical protein FVEG_13562 [Fusarium verticillioides 7600]RBR13758.1 hypothetical protein FVER53590_13562 [Fusarium verticillioides]